MGEILIYQNKDLETQIEVNFDKETVWLNLNQISELFGRDKSVISRHINAIFKEGELIRELTVVKNATVQIEGKREVEREIDYYNLDTIISVGYRVNSNKATKFRVWATQVLKEYLVQGYAINQKRLEQLEKVVEIISNQNQELNLTETKGFLEILTNYTQSFILLNKFDSNNLENTHLNENITYEINYEDAKYSIFKLKSHLKTKKEATELFGNEKDDSFNGILGNILQTFDNQYLYPTIEEQAANLLYLIIKNHPFSDGNKRIGAFIFIWFLEKNKHQFKKNGELKINDNALIAIALLVAQSNPNDKELIIKLIINLINSR